MSKQHALGRGLSALISERPKLSTIANTEQQHEIDINSIIPNEKQPRTYFNENKLNELAESIRENGVIQPIILRKINDNKYQIIAGERRWRATKMVGFATIPAIIKNIDDKNTLQLALIENIQRDDLSPVEEANSYKYLIDEFSFTQEELSKKIGKSRSHVANILRLLGLPRKIQNYIQNGLLTMGHAKVLVNSDHAENIADIIIKRDLSVRETEKLVAEHKTDKKRIKKDTPTAALSKKFIRDEDLVVLETMLTNTLGFPTSIEESKNGGKISIFFNDFNELDKIVNKITA